MKRTGKGLTLCYSLIMGFFWMNYAGIVGFSSVYLLECGLTSAQIGMILAVAGILAAAAQPFVAGYADRPSALSLKTIVSIGCVAAAVLTVLLLAVYQKSVMLTGLFYGGCVVLLQFLLPFVNSLGTEMISQGKRLNWGFARGIGSAAYAVVSYVLGVLVAKAGIVSIPVSIFVCYVLLLATVLIYPFQKGRKTESKEMMGDRTGGGHTEKSAMIEEQKCCPDEACALQTSFLKKYPRFAAVLVGTTLLYLSHHLINTFLYQVIQSKGGGSAENGLVMSLCACMELPTLFFFSYMLKKAGSETWYKVCGIFITLKAAATLLVSSLTLFYFIQIFQMFGWGLLAVAPVYYANQTVRKEDAIKGQAYMAMTCTLGSVFASFSGGSLIDAAGVNVMVGTAVAAGLIGAVIIAIFTEKTVYTSKEK